MTFPRLRRGFAENSKGIGLDVEATVDAENLKKESVVNHSKKDYF